MKCVGYHRLYRENTFLINFPFNKLFVWPAIYQCKYRRWQFKMQANWQLDSSSHSLTLTLTLFCSCLVSSACQTICASAQEELELELETNNKYTHNATSISCVSQLFVYLLAKNNRATETSLSTPPFAYSPLLILPLQLLYPSLFAFAGCVACCVLGEYSLIDFANVAF